MACSGMVEKLSGYLDGALTRTEMREVEGHLLGCAACRAELESLGTLIDEIRGLGELQPPPGLPEAVLDRVRQQRASVIPARKRWYWWPVGTAAAAALLVGVALGVTGGRVDLLGAGKSADMQLQSAPAGQSAETAPRQAAQAPSRKMADAPAFGVETFGAGVAGQEEKQRAVPEVMAQDRAAAVEPKIESPAAPEAAGQSKAATPRLETTSHPPAESGYPSRGTNGTSGTSKAQAVQVTQMSQAGQIATIPLETTRDINSLVELLEPLSVQMGGRLATGAPAGEVDLLLPAKSWEQVLGPLGELGRVVDNQAVSVPLEEQYKRLDEQLAEAKVRLEGLQAAQAPAQDLAAAEQEVTRLEEDRKRLREAENWTLVRILPLQK